MVLQIPVLRQCLVRKDLGDRLFGGALRDHADGSAAFVDIGQHFVDEFQTAVDVHVVQDWQRPVQQAFNTSFPVSDQESLPELLRRLKPANRKLA